MAGVNRIDQVEAYVLHTLPFRETSLLVDAFSATHGRVSLAARGARRPASALRGVLLPFQKVSLSWFGKGEVKTLHSAQWLSMTPERCVSSASSDRRGWPQPHRSGRSLGSAHPAVP